MNFIKVKESDDIYMKVQKVGIVSVVKNLKIIQKTHQHTMSSSKKSRMEK